LLKAKLSNALQLILKNINALSDEELLQGFHRSALVSLEDGAELSLTISLRSAIVQPPLQLPEKGFEDDKT